MKMNDTTESISSTTSAGAEAGSIAQPEPAAVSLPLNDVEDEHGITSGTPVSRDGNRSATPESETLRTVTAKNEKEKIEAAPTEAAWREAIKTQLASRPVSAPRPSKATFNALPTDLKMMIVELISRPSDLKNICLANKELHEIGVRSLYHSVSLDLGSPADSKLAAFLNPRNIGLKWIRQLRLYLAQVEDACNQDVQATFATRLIIEMLPENTLEEFR